ncbi:Uncharacterised protein [Mycolicibacterium fortuitum]|uniref:Uncharacterized protein n=1 Tax=Mycolicibacterium fortuitum TaxID=1766 RepID=A0A378WCL1_MYCFO|nr:Uncharacterised protein [Mycolicibacterium fortuitum]
MQEIRPTRAVVRILKAFVDHPDRANYGYGLMRETGYSSAKVYQILNRLTGAGWLERSEAPRSTTEAAGPPRVSYRLHPDAVAASRELITEAQKEFAVSVRNG